MKNSPETISIFQDINLYENLTFIKKQLTRELLSRLLSAAAGNVNSLPTAIDYPSVTL